MAVFFRCNKCKGESAENFNVCPECGASAFWHKVVVGSFSERKEYAFKILTGKPTQTFRGISNFVVGEDLHLFLHNECALKQVDQVLPNAIECVLSAGQVSTSLLQRRLKLSYEHAAGLIDKMEQIGIIGLFNGSAPREVIATTEQEVMSFVLEYCGYEPPTVDENTLLYSTLSIEAVDSMNGLEFEEYFADILLFNGYKKPIITKASGDQGVDLLTEKDGIRYAIQCKNYSSPLGNTPIQEVFAGKDFYNCHVGVVVTNSTFTDGALALAEKTNVLLWDRNKLISMLQTASIFVENYKAINSIN